ncbi:hypothetical protein KCU95_g9, partial [Aureobasidium melanogenum]
MAGGVNVSISSSRRSRMQRAAISWSGLCSPRDSSRTPHVDTHNMSTRRRRRMLSWVIQIRAHDTTNRVERFHDIGPCQRLQRFVGLAV